MNGQEAIKVIRKLLSRKGLGWLGDMQLVGTVYSFAYRRVVPHGVVLTEVEGSRMYLDTRDMGVAMDLIIDGSYEKAETQFFKKQVKKGMTIVDVGAHWGYYSLLAARLVGREGKVIAFEPDPYNYRLLVRNVKTNEYDNVLPVQKAVSDKVGATRLFISSDNMGDHTIYESPGGRKSVAVETVTLDHFFREREDDIDIIKIDAQGAETAVFRGMANIAGRTDDLKIFVEYYPKGLKAFGSSPQEFLNELQGNGFLLYHIEEKSGRVEPISANHLIRMCAGRTHDHTNLYCAKRALSMWSLSEPKPGQVEVN